ncbi:MAG: Cys-tRNA(Pro) deacylase [Eubacteriales bacterium]
MIKTNVTRLLTASKIEFETKEYEVDESDLSGVHAAAAMGVDCADVYKTLVLHGERHGYFVCVIPVADEVDLKKAAVAEGEKKCELIPMKDLLAVTGYIRGGCSPVGMKKKFPTFIDVKCLMREKIAVSAGQRGVQIVLAPAALINFVGAKSADITRDAQ